MESLDLIKKLKLKRFIFYTSWRGHTFVGHIGGGGSRQGAGGERGRTWDTCLY